MIYLISRQLQFQVVVFQESSFRPQVLNDNIPPDLLPCRMVNGRLWYSAVESVIMKEYIKSRLKQCRERFRNRTFQAIAI